MIKKFFLSLGLFVIISITANAQYWFTQYAAVTGANSVFEGGTYRYEAVRTGTGSIPPGIVLNISIENGTWDQSLGYNIDLYNGANIYIYIKWNCLVANGTLGKIKIEDQAHHFIELPVTINSNIGPLFCTQITPPLQDVIYGEVPQTLQITNCSPACEDVYLLQYQWEFSSVSAEIPAPDPGMEWHKIIINGQNATYTPPPFFEYEGKYLRRKTKYYYLTDIEGQPLQHESISDPALVKFFKYLDAGTITINNPIIHAYNTVPVINQTPATGGLCYAADYHYTWQSRDEPAGNWAEIGYEEIFPVNAAPLSVTRSYRRKVVCGGEEKYTNELRITFDYISPHLETNINYVREVTVLKPGVKNWPEADNLKIGEKFQLTTYQDGAGRAIQNIQHGVSTPQSAGAVWGDIISFGFYDEFGRQKLGYLPYADADGQGKFITDVKYRQSHYYREFFDDDHTPYSKPNFEKSPLGRIKNLKSPGDAWANSNGISSDLNLNTTDDNIRRLKIGFAQDATPEQYDTYDRNELFKSITEDENKKKIIEFTDKAGQLIVKKVQLADDPAPNDLRGWISTYNIYDDFGRLRYTLQPEAVKYLEENGWDFTRDDAQKILNEQCFRYLYDRKGRLISKKAPGAAELKMAYDKRDRPVYLQDGNQRINGQVTITLYDDLDRVKLTALFTPSMDISSLQDLLNSTEVNEVENLAENDLINPSVNAVVLKKFYYDDYSFTGAATFVPGFHNSLAYPSAPDIDAIQWSKRIKSFTTGSLTRILGTDNFIESTIYYDDKGRVIQSISNNIKNGKDIVTNQYHWNGKLMSSESIHSVPNTDFNNYSILTKNIYDKIWKLINLEKKYGDNPFKLITSYEYESMGRLKSKLIDPGYQVPGKTELGMEKQDFSYNIHSQITGINRDYALKTPGDYSKWEKFFGICLGYAHGATSRVFDKENLNGQVAGIMWNSQGDDNQRKYEYKYDNAGRLTQAEFKELKNNTWSNAQLDFSVGGYGEGNKMEYDLNGNLLSMIQMGVLVGRAGTVVVDKLRYEYYDFSNKLKSVNDYTELDNATQNGNLGDFKNGENGEGTDYVYDENGNLIIDLNKGVRDLTEGVSTDIGLSGIQYNFLDKPEKINIPNEGLIKLVYNANGTKLQKIFTSEQTGVTTTTTYINQFVYQENSAAAGLKLSYINFEEGRIRYIDPVDEASVSPNPTATRKVAGTMDMPGNAAGNNRGVYDFYIRDYQQNVRMIVTEEVHEDMLYCSMENTNAQTAAWEEDHFGNQGSNEVVNTRVLTNTIPGLLPSNGFETYASLVQRGTKKMGPNRLLKVMAGDEITASTSYYYNGDANNPGGATHVFTDVVKSFFGALSGNAAAPASAKLAGENFYSGQYLGLVPFTNAIAPDEGATDNIPMGYLTILFFDERFNFVGTGDASPQRVHEEGNDAEPLTLDHIKAPKNGYAFIYVSNESITPVYFDNFWVKQERGRIIEENHYYAYGLKIAAISSRKLPDEREGKIDNKNLYNDKELIDDGDIAWYDYGFRNYDAQIGRFTQLDPLTFEYEFLTPYQYASCDPIDNIDIDGLEGGLSTYADPIGLDDVSILQAPRLISSQSLFQSTRPWLSAFNATVNMVGRNEQQPGVPNYKVYPSALPPIVKQEPKPLFGAGSQYEEYQKNNEGINGYLKKAEFLWVSGGGPRQNVYRNGFGETKYGPSDWGSEALGSELGSEIVFNVLTLGNGLVAKGVAKGLTTADGFLLGGFKVKAPFDIPVQRFGNMSVGRSDFWGARIGTSQFTNRTFGAIKPVWNPLTQYTTGIIPKGTPIKFGIIGPQGLWYPGGSLQFILPSKSVISQSTKIIQR